MKATQYCAAIEASIKLGYLDYAITAAKRLLERLPGHIPARCLLGQALLEKELPGEARQQFEAVLQLDPENIIARQGLGRTHRREGDLPRAIQEYERALHTQPTNRRLKESLLSLYCQLGSPRTDMQLPPAALARLHLDRGAFSQAIELCEAALAEGPPCPEIALAKLEALWRAGHREAARRSAQAILERWPTCVKGKLILADLLLAEGDHAEGVALLHEAQALDPSGVVAHRLFKDANPYAALWAWDVDLLLPSPPPEIERTLAREMSKGAEEQGSKGAGGQRSGGAEERSLGDFSSAPQHLCTSAQMVVEEARAELDRLIEWLSLEGTQPPKAAPLYLIISNKDGLRKKYGERGFAQLNRDLCELKQTIESHRGLEAMIIYVDDKPSLVPCGLEPVDPTNPWQIKTLIDDLDAGLAERGQEVRYLLIVGGDSIIPFHRLPNPTDDQDMDIPSDNPYASRDANYLIPERAVGRLPDGEGEEVSFLCSLIQTAIAGHRRPAMAGGLLSALLRAFWPANRALRNEHSLGYSASIWRKTSRAVFQVIGDDRQLRTSPPLTYQEFGGAELPYFSYFNLHGIEDGAYWYGQRDPLFPADYPLFPVALRPQDLAAVEQATSIVFTEACYGANIMGKDTNNSIALRFLASQALALVGSTKVSYGSIAPPLLGADLIGRYFWEGLRARLTLGEALKYAKGALAKEMYKRYGYLDGEDQKTLISFVLYGDPSLEAGIFDGKKATKISGLGIDFCPPIFCQKRARRQKLGLVSDELIAEVKNRVEASLPHMAQARVSAVPLAFCNENCGHRCPLICSAVKGARQHLGNWIFTLEKAISTEGGIGHRQIVKATIDEKGHILKIAISK
jgi:tetratricopeptide (TPR) repeat protein